MKRDLLSEHIVDDGSQLFECMVFETGEVVEVDYVMGATLLIDQNVNSVDLGVEAG